MLYLALYNKLTTKQYHQQSMSHTSILEGVKATGSKYSSNKQFVIKSKPNIKENKQTIDYQNGQVITATPKDIQLFLNYMKERSTRFQELLAQNAVLNEEEFCQKHLFSSICIKTILKSVLDKLLAEKRLGKNLKGMNKSNMEQIQGHIWSSLEREVALYQNERKYIWERDQLKGDLEKRKRQILKDLENVTLRFEEVERELCLDQQQGSTQNEEQKNGYSENSVSGGQQAQNEEQIEYECNKNDGSNSGRRALEVEDLQA